MHCREILFTPCCKGQSFEDQVNFSLRRTFAELRGVKVVQCSDFCLFFLYKTPKTYLPVTSIQPRGYIAEWGSRRSKGVPSGTGCFLRLLVGELRTPKLAQIFAYGKWLYPYIMLLHWASGLDQRCLKTRNSEAECTFPPNIFAPTAKITPKPHFGGFFNAKPIIQTALRQSHVNGVTTLKLYDYHGLYSSTSCCISQIWPK